MRKPRNKGTAILINQPWALKREVLEQGLSMIGDATALQAAAGGFGEVSGDGLYIQDGVAIIDMIGPVTRYETCLSMMYGYATVEALMAAFQLAQDDITVRSILLNVNSPGGSVDGISELADMVAASSKPVVVYVGGMSCSAAYWISAKATKIVANQTGMIGSIGVYAAYTDERRAQKEAGIDEYMIVSSQSPNKVPDPATDAGKAKIQEHVDALATIFISAVADGRGVSVQTVIDNFGQGDVFLGADAVSRGMADSVGNFTDALQLAMTVGQSSPIGFSATDKTAGVANAEIRTEEVQVMDLTKLKAEHPEVYQAAAAEGAVQERARIAAIDSLGLTGDLAKLAEEAKADGKSSHESVAAKAWAANQAKIAKMKADRAQDAEEVPGVIDNGKQEPEGEQAVGLLKGAFKSKGRK